MSTTQISFNVELAVGTQSVPLTSELVLGADAAAGVQQGLLFKLNQQPGDPPVTVTLGDIIGLVENALGAGVGVLASNPGLTTLAQALPNSNISATTFTSDNSLSVAVQSFELNSTTEEFLFSISVDVQSSNPNAGLLALPTALTNWLKIDSVAIAFSATTKPAATA